MSHFFYDQMLNRIVTDSCKYRISFEHRTLIIDHHKVELPTDEFLDWSIAELVGELQYLFDGYYNSVPSERTDHQRHTYFVSLPLSQLSDDDMVTGLLREQAQFALELFFLLNIVNGKFLDFPFRSDKDFFWQPSENHPLIVHRSWIEPK